MILHVLDRLVELPLARIVVVVGHGAETVSKTVQEQLATEIPLEFVEQTQAARHRRRGQRRPHRLGRSTSTPRTTCSCSPATRRCCAPTPSPRSPPSTASPTPRPPSSPPSSTTPRGTGASSATADGAVDRIVEQADANDAELDITEVNSSIYCFRRGLLAPALRRLEPENGKGEYYLTDVIGVLRAAGHLVVGTPARRPDRDARA